MPACDLANNIDRIYDSQFIVGNLHTAKKTGFQCDNPLYSREPDELDHRKYDWCVDNGFHKPVGHKQAKNAQYPVTQRLKRIELAFRERSFVDFDYLVACETGKDLLACGRNLMLTGKAPLCTEIATDNDNDGVCDGCIWDPEDAKAGACEFNPKVRIKRAWPLPVMLRRTFV